MGEGVKIGGGTSLAIDGLEQIGELKLTTKYQWIGEETPILEEELSAVGFAYKGLVHIIAATTHHKKLVNNAWVDDIVAPVEMADFCSNEDYVFSISLSGGKIYRFNGTEWTLILTISEASGATGNIEYDNEKLYCCIGANAYVISLSDLSYEQIPAMTFTEQNGQYSYKPLSFKVFVLNGELYGTYIYYKGYYANERWLTNIMKYDKTSRTWGNVGNIDNWRAVRTALSVENNVAYMFTGFNMCTFDGISVKSVYAPCETGNSMFHLNGVLYSIGSIKTYHGGSTNSNIYVPITNTLMSYRKTLCLEV